MAIYSKIPLNGVSSTGRGIKVAATAIATSPTLIHTGSNTSTTIHEVWLYAQNNHTADVALRIGFGNTTDPDDIIEYSVKTKGGLYLIVPGLLLQGNATALTVKAAANTANVISIFGYVNAIA